MQFVGKLRDQNSEGSSGGSYFRAFSDRRSSSTAIYSPTHTVTFQEAYEQDIVIPSTIEAAECKKNPYLIPRCTKSGYKLPQVLDNDTLKADQQQQLAEDSESSCPKVASPSPGTGEVMTKDVCRSTNLARERTFTGRVSTGSWQTTAVKGDLEQIRTHIVGNHGDKISTIRVAKSPASRLMNLKLSIERLISLDGFDPLFSQDPGCPAGDENQPIQSLDNLDREVLTNQMEYFPDILTDSEPDEGSARNNVNGSGDFETKTRKSNPILQREGREDHGTRNSKAMKVFNHVFHHRTDLKVVEQLDKIKNMKEKSATILCDHEQQRISLINPERHSLENRQALNAAAVRKDEYMTVAELLEDINADEQDPLGLFDGANPRQTSQAISELEAFVMAFDSAIDILKQNHDLYKVSGDAEKTASTEDLYSQLPYLLNTLVRSKDYLVARSIRRTGKVDLLKTQARELERNLKVIMEENQRLYKELGEVKESYDKLKENLADTVAKLDSLQYSKAKTERELNSLRDNYEAMRQARITMEVELGELALERDEAFARSKRLTIAAGRLRTIADSAVTRAQNAEKRVILEVRSKQEVEKAYKKASEEASFLSQKLKRQEIQYKGELQELEREISKLRSVIDELNNAADFQSIDTRTIIRSIMESGNASKIMQMAAETVETLTLPETVTRICASCPEVDQLGLASLVHLLKTLRDPTAIHHFFTIINKEPLITVPRKVVGVQTVPINPSKNGGDSGTYDKYQNALYQKSVSLKGLYAKQLGQGAAAASAADYTEVTGVGSAENAKTQQEQIKEERVAIKNALKTMTNNTGIAFFNEEQVVDTGLVVGDDGTENLLADTDLASTKAVLQSALEKSKKASKKPTGNIPDSSNVDEKSKPHKASGGQTQRSGDSKTRSNSKKIGVKALQSIETACDTSARQPGSKVTPDTKNVIQSNVAVEPDNFFHSNSLSDIPFKNDDDLSRQQVSNNSAEQPKEELEFDSISPDDFEVMIAILTDNMKNTRMVAQIKMVLSYMLFKSAFCDGFRYLFLDFYKSYFDDFNSSSMTDEEKQELIFSFVDDFKLRMRIVDDDKMEVLQLSNIAYNMGGADQSSDGPRLPNSEGVNDVSLGAPKTTVQSVHSREAVELDQAVHLKSAMVVPPPLHDIGTAPLSLEANSRNLKVMVPVVSRSTEHIYADVLTPEDLIGEPEHQNDNCYADVCVMKEELPSDKQSFVADQSISNLNTIETSDPVVNQTITDRQHITRHAYVDLDGKTRLNDTTNAKAKKIKTIRKGIIETNRKGTQIPTADAGKCTEDRGRIQSPPIPQPESIKSIMNRIGPVIKREDKKTLQKSFKKTSTRTQSRRGSVAMTTIPTIPEGDERVTASPNRDNEANSTKNVSSNILSQASSLPRCNPVLMPRNSAPMEAIPELAEEHLATDANVLLKEYEEMTVTVAAGENLPSNYFSNEEMDAFDSAMKAAEIRDFPGGFAVSFHSTKDTLEDNVSKAISGSKPMLQVEESQSKKSETSIVEVLSSTHDLDDTVQQASNTDAYSRVESVSTLNPMEGERVELDTPQIGMDLQSNQQKPQYVMTYLQDNKGQRVPILVQGNRFYGRFNSSNEDMPTGGNGSDYVSQSGQIKLCQFIVSGVTLGDTMVQNQEIGPSNKSLSMSMRQFPADANDQTLRSSDNLSWKDQINELTSLDEELNILNNELQELVDRRSNGSTSPNSRSAGLRSQSRLRTLKFSDCSVQTDYMLGPFGIPGAPQMLFDEASNVSKNPIIALSGIEPSPANEVDFLQNDVGKSASDTTGRVLSASDKNAISKGLILANTLSQWTDILHRNPILYNSPFISGYAFSQYSRSDPVVRYNFAKPAEVQLFIQSFSETVQTDVISVCSSDKDTALSKPMFTPLREPKIAAVQTDVYGYHLDKLITAVRLAKEVTNPREYLRYDNPRFLRGVDVSCVNMNTKSMLPLTDPYHSVRHAGTFSFAQPLPSLGNNTILAANSQAPTSFSNAYSLTTRNPSLLLDGTLSPDLQGKGKPCAPTMHMHGDNSLLSGAADIQRTQPPNKPRADMPGLLENGVLNPEKYRTTGIVEDFLYVGNQHMDANEQHKTRKSLLQVAPLFPFQSDMNINEQPDNYLTSSLSESLDEADEANAVRDIPVSDLNAILRQTSRGKFARVVNKIYKAGSKSVPESDPSEQVQEHSPGSRYIQVAQPNLLPDVASILSKAYLSVLAQPESRFISNFGVSPIRPFVLHSKGVSKRFFANNHAEPLNVAAIPGGMAAAEVKHVVQYKNVLFNAQRRPPSRPINAMIGVTDNTAHASKYKTVAPATEKTGQNAFVTVLNSPNASPKATNNTQSPAQTAAQKQSTGQDNGFLVVTALSKPPVNTAKASQFSGPVHVSLNYHPRFGSLTYIQANPLNLVPYCYFLMQTTLDRVFAKYAISSISNVASLQQNQDISDDRVIKPNNNVERLTICSPCLLSTKVKFHRDMAPNSPMQKTTLSYIDEELKHARQSELSSSMVKPLMKQATTLLPNVGDQVSFIRLSSASLRYASDHGMLDVNKASGGLNEFSASIDSLPLIFRLLEQVTHTPTQIVASLVSKQAYIRIPINSCYLKSLVWTIKIIRLILHKRQVATETIIVAQHNEHRPEYSAEKNLLHTSIGAPHTNDEHITNAYKMTLVPGELSREDAESLPQFLVHWCNSRYGLRTLVSSLLYCIVANVVYYQYDNEEVYLFARMLFSDLDNDYFLTYIDFRKSLQLGANFSEGAKEMRDTNIDVVEHIPVAAIEPLLGAMFSNWDHSRRADLCSTIVGSYYGKGTYSLSNPTELTVPFARIVAITFYAYTSFRKTLYQALQTILLHFGREHGCTNSVNEAAFRELCNHTIKQWNAEIIAEQFYNFSQLEEIPQVGADAYAQINGSHGDYLEGSVRRIMDVDNFIDLFVSNQLARFLTISTDILEKSVDTEVKRNIHIITGLFERLTALSEEASKQLMCEDILSGTATRMSVIRRIKDNLAAIASDIACYDHHHALLNIKHTLDTILGGLLETDVDSVSVTLGGAIAALESYFSSQVIDEIVPSEGM